MAGRLKVSACIIFVLAVLFYFFFQITKHNLALSQVNAFADDPYDAVGSFGVQFAMFTALLSLMRAFRPYQPGGASDDQKLLFLRGTYISCLSVAVTLVADVVAMLRHPSLWIGLPAGLMLAVLIGGMGLLTVLVGWLLSLSTPAIMLLSRRDGWARAIIISVADILILALYPEYWRQSTPGGLFTVVVGAILFFVPVWALGITIVPSLETYIEDFIDDLVSVYRWLKAHAGPFVVLFTILEKLFGLPFIRLLLNWLNPRRHTWNCAILIGMVMGLLLALGEAIGEGGPRQVARFVLVAAVYVSLEGFAVLLGYALLAKPLGLFRQDSAGKVSQRAYQGSE